MDERLNAPTTFRVMGPHEKGRFAPDAWGHLLSLNGSGAINGPELEATGLEETGPGADNATVH